MVDLHARVDERDAPVGDVACQRARRPRAAVREHEVVGERLVVVEEVLLDALALVAEAEDEVVVAPRRVVLHDVPEDRPVADRDHRLRDPLRLLAHPHAETAAEDDDLHRYATSRAIRSPTQAQLAIRTDAPSHFARPRRRVSSWARRAPHAATSSRSSSQVSPRKWRYCSARSRSARRPGRQLDVVVGEDLVLGDVAPQPAALDEALGQVAAARSSPRR